MAHPHRGALLHSGLRSEQMVTPRLSLWEADTEKGSRLAQGNSWIQYRREDRYVVHSHPTGSWRNIVRTIGPGSVEVTRGYMSQVTVSTSWGWAWGRAPQGAPRRVQSLMKAIFNATKWQVKLHRPCKWGIQQYQQGNIVVVPPGGVYPVPDFFSG